MGRGLLLQDMDQEFVFQEMMSVIFLEEKIVSQGRIAKEAVLSVEACARQRLMKGVKETVEGSKPEHIGSSAETLSPEEP